MKEAHSLDAPGYGSAKAIGVYVDPGDPSNAMIDNPVARLIQGSLVIVPLAGGLAVLAVGLTRRWRWERRKARAVSASGRGLDPEWVARRLGELRRGRRDTP